MSDALAYLAEYSPAMLDTILDVIGTPIAAPDSDLSEEPFCVTCDAPLGVFPADGLYYRHYREAGGDLRRYSVDHPTVVGWRQAMWPQQSESRRSRRPADGDGD
jgi:hypothetical protein